MLMRTCADRCFHSTAMPPALRYRSGRSAATLMPGLPAGAGAKHVLPNALPVISVTIVRFAYAAPALPALCRYGPAHDSCECFVVRQTLCERTNENPLFRKEP